MWDRLPACRNNREGRGEELAYLPDGGEVKVDLSGANGKFSVEWMHPITGQITPGTILEGTQWRSLKAPFGGDAVVFLWRLEAARAKNKP